MEKAYDKSLQVRLEEYIAEVGGQRKAAAAIGYSEATISTYRNGKYAGDVAKLESRLRELLGNADAAAELAVPDTYVPTSISQGVYETIRLCHLKGGAGHRVRRRRDWQDSRRSKVCRGLSQQLYLYHG